MRLPEEPKSGYLISEWGRALLRYLRGERLAGVVGGRLQQGADGKTLIIDFPKQDTVGRKRLPFEIFVSYDSTETNDYILSFEPGLIDSTTISAITQAADYGEIWYLQAKIVYNATTGVVSSRTLEWVSTEDTNDSTTSYHTIGAVDTGAGPGELTKENYTYGPMTTIPYGDVNDEWRIALI